MSTFSLWTVRSTCNFPIEILELRSRTWFSKDARLSKVVSFHLGPRYRVILEGRGIFGSIFESHSDLILESRDFAMV